MRSVQRFTRFAAAAAVIVLCGSAAAQTSHSYRLSCQPFGNSQPEPLGDREGHVMVVGQFSCLIEGGLLDGGVMTGNAISEWDGANGVGVTHSGVARIAGASVVVENEESKSTVTVVDGKVTGFTGSGRGVYKLATGSAASLSGKTYSFTSRSTGPFRFTTDVTVD